MGSPKASDVVHKVNNLLTVIFSQTAVSDAVPDDSERARRALKLIEKSALEASDLVQRFASTLKSQSGE